MAQPPAPPPFVAKLQRLITFMTISMIVGIAVITFLIFMIWFEGPAAPALPDSISLPDGETAVTVTQGSDWSGVVTRDADGNERIHFLNSDGSIARTVEID